MLTPSVRHISLNIPGLLEILMVNESSSLGVTFMPGTARYKKVFSYARLVNPTNTSLRTYLRDAKSLHISLSRRRFKEQWARICSTKNKIGERIRQWQHARKMLADSCQNWLHVLRMIGEYCQGKRALHRKLQREKHRTVAGWIHDRVKLDVVLHAWVIGCRGCARLICSDRCRQCYRLLLVTTGN